MGRQRQGLGRRRRQRREVGPGGDDRRQGIVSREAHDGRRRSSDVPEAEPERGAWSEIGQRLSVIRTDRNVYTKAPSCLEERLGSIGGAREEEKNPWQIAPLRVSATSPR